MFVCEVVGGREGGKGGDRGRMAVAAQLAKLGQLLRPAVMRMPMNVCSH